MPNKLLATQKLFTPLTTKTYAWVGQNLTQIHFKLDVLCQLEKELLFRNKLLKLKTCQYAKKLFGENCAIC